MYRLMCRCTPWLPAGCTVTSPVPSRRGVPARRSAVVSAEKSSATKESATMPAVPPTSCAGTSSKVPRPTASIVRGPPFIATSVKPNRDWKVSAVAPGIVDTPMYGSEMHAFLKTLQPAGRIGTVRDIADAVLYLTHAEFTTGVVLPVDGGMAAGRF